MNDKDRASRQSNTSDIERQPDQPVSQLFGEHNLAALSELVSSCPDAPAWPIEAWKSFLGVHAGNGALSRALFAQMSGPGSLAGIIAVTCMHGTTELELLLVPPHLRRLGIGYRLSCEWLRWAAQEHATEALLEVRASNIAAQRLYRRLGFSDEGRRRGYYRNPVEDALLMRGSIHSIGEKAH